MSVGSLLPVMERFYTVQGEGRFSGYASWFIRLAGCDVGCVWCDVKESWDAEGFPLLSVEFLANEAKESGANRVVITGGEPCLYDLSALCNALHALNLLIHIETSASSPIRGDFDWICISPKKFKAPIPSELMKAHELKIIVFNASDFKWAESFVSEVPASCHLLLQPEWEKSNQMLPLIVTYVKNNPQWQISLQTHKYMQIP
jgi:7-carboxy-7-deazaguanine synthase